MLRALLLQSLCGPGVLLLKFAIAVLGPELEYMVIFPQSAILYLRSIPSTPDFVEIQIVVPGDSCSYKIPAVKVKDFSVDDIYQKQLYFLIPFYSFVFEQTFSRCEKDEKKLDELCDIFLNIRQRLKAVSENGTISEYYFQTVMDMACKIVKNLAGRYAKTSERIGDIMRGRILEYEAKTIMNEGRAEGRQEGRIEGLQEGQIKVFLNMVQRGFSVDEAMSLAEITKEQADKALATLKNSIIQN